MRKLAGLVFLLGSAAFPVHADIEEPATRPNCTTVWIEAIKPLPVCDVAAITAGLESHARICVAASAEDAVVIVHLSDCRKAAAVPAPTAAWVLHDIHAEVKCRGFRREFWASDRHSWRGAGRDLAEEVVTCLEEAE